MSQEEVKEEVKEEVQVEAKPQEPPRPWIHITSERLTETALRWIFFWETDPVRLGTLIRFLHHSFVYCMIILYIMIHSVYPSYPLLILFTFLMSLVWAQHILTGGCILSKLEQRFLGDTKSFVDPILGILQMPITRESAIGLTTYTSTLVLAMSSLEVLARTSLYIKTFFSW